MQTAFELIERLKPRLITDFQRMLLSAAMQNIQDVSNPLRLNNFSAAFRELFRHILDELAPSEKIIATSWFVPDVTNNGRVTRAQKVNYVVHAGLDPAYVEDELGIDVTAERRALLQTIDQLSKFTHVNEDSFGSSPEEVERYAYAVCEVLQSFLDCADDARELLCEKVAKQVHEDVINEAIRETILSLDEIAAHHCVDEVYVHDIEVASMDHTEILFTAYGSLGVELQWGSNSDVRRGEGAVMRNSYPLTCKFVSKVGSPEELEVVEDSLCVDTRSWWDGYYDEGEPS